MSIYGFGRRVVCYVTRTTPHGDQLLVFEHADDDPSDPSGLQVPAGTMLPFESVADAAVREVAEETGLSDLEYVDQIGAQELALYDEGGPVVINVLRLVARGNSSGEPVEDRAEWDHVVTGEGADAGLTFRCRWEPLPLGLELAGGQGNFLSHLTG